MAALVLATGTTGFVGLSYGAASGSQPITAVGALAYADSTATALSVSPRAAGDLLLLVVDASGGPVKSVAGGGVGTWNKDIAKTGSHSGQDDEIWWGVVTSTGAATIKVGFTGSHPNDELMAQEYNDGNGVTWSAGATGSSTSGTSKVTFPSLSPSGAGELYVGFASVWGAGRAGSTPGFTYTVTPGYSNLLCRDSALSSTASPTASQTSTGSDSVGALFAASSGAPTDPSTSTSTATTTSGPTATTTAPGTTMATAPTPTTVATTTAPITTAPGGNGYPASGTAICGTALLQSPYSSSNAPALGTTTNVVTVPAGAGSGSYSGANTTYYFAPGTHTGVSVIAGPGSYYVGEYSPGLGAAVLDGGGKISFAEQSQGATHVTWEYLTVQHYDPPGSQAAVNQNGWDNQTFAYDTMQDNYPGAGLMLGTDNTLSESCLTHNGQYGFQAYTTNDVDPVTGGPGDVVVTNNEISYNDQCNWEAFTVGSGQGDFPFTPPSQCHGAGQFDGCGCSGGAKFWQVNGSNVTGNYVHDNYDPGLWWDTDNNNEVVKGNYFSNNLEAAVQVEISYNALIEDNNFVDNTWIGGQQNPGFPSSAVYISESGGDGRVPPPPGFSPVVTTLTVSGNGFTNNWGGVVVWENSNRYCGSSANSSTGICTLVDPRVNLANCAELVPGGFTGSYSGPSSYWDCRWRSQDVIVTDNIFNMVPSAVPGCVADPSYCGFNGIFSEYGSGSWGCTTSAASCGYAFPDNIVDCAIAFDQGNVFSDNTYTGSWQFMAVQQGNVVSQATWQQASQPKSCVADSGSPTYSAGLGQDAGSTFS